MQRQRWLTNSSCEDWHYEECKWRFLICDYHISVRNYLGRDSLEFWEKEEEQKRNVYWTFEKILVIRMKLCPCFHCCVEREKKTRIALFGIDSNLENVNERIKNHPYMNENVKTNNLLCECFHCDLEKQKINRYLLDRKKREIKMKKNKRKELMIEIANLSKKLKNIEAELSKTISPETREKMRQAALGRKFSQEHKDKIRQAHLGRKFSQETIEKMSEAHKGKKQSPEALAKRHATRKANGWNKKDRVE